MRLILCIGFILGALAVSLVAYQLVVRFERVERQICTHGTSSIGPIKINTGQPVRATPHTEACQP